MAEQQGTGQLGRRGLIAAATGLVGADTRAQTGASSAWPERPVTIVVCFPPGGSTDFSARMVAPGLSELLGKPVVIENRPGAGGNIGIGVVARAQPDGHTLLVASSVFVVNASLYRTAPYDPFRDFAPVGTLGASPNLICVRSDSGITSFAALIAAARTNPERFNYASPGIGTTPHLAGEVLKLRTGVNLTHVPFLGAGPAVQAILAGTTEVLIASQGGQVEIAVRSGQIKALAQTGAERAPDIPDVPTLTELGLKDAVSETFNALYAPAATPSAVIRRLDEAVLAVLHRPEVQHRYRAGGVIALPEGAAGLKARVAREVPLWREVIRQARIAAE
ncbi:tripartite tricarboxylate transporter substrate binding protein [Paeniroseomonas aquatica]|uniref:Tripartite tricarboxylate transporter substrate binding protein n=1 Tax=Paeniroseomonas aquatica TaxID=373043 RepID=A0ABT8A6H2_9PROT|nr:tripartite tricarboxylate transporter substrate binding protein [Paeniroseomonas aquatica]MDN3565389.1 tripartite tricarboxylate transporter substrate binding protein [Paeniroseomonas aquatica]